MVNLIEGALTIGSAAYLYHSITKEQVLSEDNIRNGTIGALAGLILGPKLEELIKSDMTLTEEQKKQIFGTVIGAGVGGGIGYAASNKAVDYLKEQLGKYKKKPLPESTENKE